jgi:hypothetical protein
MLDGMTHRNTYVLYMNVFNPSMWTYMVNMSYRDMFYTSYTDSKEFQQLDLFPSSGEGGHTYSVGVP